MNKHYEEVVGHLVAALMRGVDIDNAIKIEADYIIEEYDMCNSVSAYIVDEDGSQYLITGRYYTPHEDDWYNALYESFSVSTADSYLTIHSDVKYEVAMVIKDAKNRYNNQNNNHNERNI